MNFAKTAEPAGEIKSNRLDNTLPLRVPKYFNASSSHVYLNHAGKTNIVVSDVQPLGFIPDSVECLWSLLLGCMRRPGNIGHAPEMARGPACC